MKNYDLIINGEKICTGKKINMFRANSIMKNPEKMMALQINNLPQEIRIQLKQDPSKIETDNLLLQHIVNFVKKNGFPEWSDEYFEEIIFATYSEGTNQENKLAIQSSFEAFKKFESFSIDQRIEILESFVDRFTSKLETFRSLSHEIGVFNLFEPNFNLNIPGPLNHSSLMFYKQQLMPKYLTNYNYILKQPYGIFGIMLPYNDYLFDWIPVITSSIISGNVCIVKVPRYPAMLFEAVGILHDVLTEFNAPKGLVNLISGSSAEIMEEWINNEDVKGIVFYGDSETGLDMAGRAVKKAKKVILQLAGSDPVLVWKDVNDLNEVVEKIMQGRFNMSGQMCNSVKRVYVHSDIYMQFIDKLVKEISVLKIASPEDLDYNCSDQIMIGSLKALRQINEAVEDAVKKGAMLKMGGQRTNFCGQRDDSGLFFAPTLLTNVNHDMKIMTQESFGPVLPIMEIQNIHEAIDLINNSKYGMRASLWAEDKEIKKMFINQVNAGNIIINELNNVSYYYSPHQGGTKFSGISGVKYFHEEMCYQKCVYDFLN